MLTTFPITESVALPVSPAEALLEAGGADKLVALNGSGVGMTVSYATAHTTGAAADLGDEDEGTTRIADGGSATRLTSADISAVLAAANADDARTALGAATRVTTTRGDMVRRGLTDDERVVLAANGNYWRSDGVDPGWATIPETDIVGLPWSAVVPHTEVTTANATPTLLANISTAADRSYAINVTVFATLAPDVVVAWNLLIPVHSDSMGALTVNDVLITGPSDAGASGLDVDVDASGFNVRIMVTGLAATNILWAVAGTLHWMEN